MNLGALLDQLRLVGIVIDDDPVVLSVARDLKILQLANGSTQRFLRILERGKGERDFAHLRFLETRLGDRINAPSSVITTDDLACGESPFVAHFKVTHERLVSGNLLPEVAKSLVLMHEAGRDFCATAAPVGTSFSPESAFEKGATDDATRSWLESTLRHLTETQPAVAQHCDFTYANLGIAQQGRLIIFDWEEYGTITYPAFDFTTFLLGHYHFEGVIGRALDSPVALIDLISRDFGKAFLGNLGLTVKEYTRVFPAYLFTFLTLKQGGFGAAINKRMQSMWSQLLQSGEWASAMRAPVS